MLWRRSSLGRALRLREGTDRVPRSTDVASEPSLRTPCPYSSPPVRHPALAGSGHPTALFPPTFVPLVARQRAEPLPFWQSQHRTLFSPQHPPAPRLLGTGANVPACDCSPSRAPAPVQAYLAFPWVRQTLPPLPLPNLVHTRAHWWGGPCLQRRVFQPPALPVGGRAGAQSNPLARSPGAWPISSA